MEATILTRMKQGMLQFLDELIDWLPEQKDLLVARIMVDTQISTVALMEMLNENVYPHRKEIDAREEKFFLDDPQIFSKVKDKSQVSVLKQVWKSPDFTKDDKEKVWKWMDFFIKLIKAYQPYLPKKK